MSFPNVYTHRKVAENAARGCEICFKPATSVLITAENKDFFYICPSHLKERGFCTPIIDTAAEEAKKKKKEEEKERLLKEEIERVKKDYEEKQQKKKGKEKDKTKDEDKDKDKSKDNDKDKGDKVEKKNTSGTPDDSEKTDDSPDDSPRIFALQKFVYQQRVEKKRQIEIARRNQERMANPDFFPSVPKALP